MADRVADISIIIPVYNAETYLQRCIDSILNQTYSKYELIVIDDGSIDNTAMILDHYKELFENIKVVHKKNGGSASARNLGLALVQTKYVIFVDADDYIHPQYLEILHTVAEQNDADIVQCGFEITKNLHTEMQEQQIGNQVNYSCVEFLEKFCRRATYLSVAVLWNKIYKFTLFDNLQFPEGKGIDDEYIICHVISRAETIIQIPNRLYYYYMSPNSQMRSAPSLKSIDGVEAIEGQLKLFKDLKLSKLYNMLLYRYYASVAANCEMLKKFFPEEVNLLKEMNDKKKGWKSVLLLKEIPIREKLFLIIRMYFPTIYKKLHKAVKK